jgi:methionyl aminopeptidase
MRRAGRVLAGILEQLARAVTPGMMTLEIDQLAARLIADAGAIAGFKGYQNFPRHICISVNEEVVHGIPGKRIIRAGDIVSLDLGIILDGYWADSGMTVTVDEVDPEARRLVDVTREALYRGIDQVRPGNRLGDVSHAIQRHVEDAGFSVVRQYAGHGIGRDMHEDPQVPNFGDAGRGPLLKPGMVLAIEPMVNQGNWQVATQPDQWTVVTTDGKLSAYWEHTVAVTEDGPAVLTALEAA